VKNFHRRGISLFALLGVSAMVSVPAIVLLAPVAPAVATCACETDETAVEDCTELIEVPIGEQIHLKPILDGSVGEAVLVADLGTINGDYYMPPSSLPASGVDQVQVKAAATGEILATLAIQILPAEGAAPPSQAPTLNASMATIDLDEEEYPAAGIPDVTVVEPIYTPLANTTQCPTTTIGGQVGQDLPLHVVSSQAIGAVHILQIGGQARQKGRKCGINPKPSWVGKKCSPAGALKSVDSKPRSYKKGTPTSTSAGATITIGPIGAGTTITFMVQPAVSVYYKDVYKCVGGKWTFAYTKKCVKDGVYGYGFTPGGDVGGQALGYPADPGFKFGSGDYTCTKL